MTVLDATKLESENDLAVDIDTGEEMLESADADETPPSAALGTPGPVRSFSLDLPTEAETTIKIIAQQGADNAWRVVYQIARQYETSPQERNNIDEAVINLENNGINHLGYAILEAVDEAALWVSSHSDDGDEKAITALHFLETWYDELDVESVTEAIFDPLPEPVEVAEVASETLAAACECDNATKPTAVTVKVSGCSDINSYNKAVADFEDQKQFLQNRLCVLLGEEESISEELKEIRQARKRVAKQYHEHLAKGPERLPLIDNAPQPDSNQPLLNQPTEIVGDGPNYPSDATELTPAVPYDSEPVAEPVAADDESWRDILIEQTSIPTPICKILNEDNQVYTLGQLADVTSEPNTSLTDLRKIGQAKADKIDEAMAEFWAANPRK